MTLPPDLARDLAALLERCMPWWQGHPNDLHAWARAALVDAYRAGQASMTASPRGERIGGND